MILAGTEVPTGFWRDSGWVSVGPSTAWPEGLGEVGIGLRLTMGTPRSKSTVAEKSAAPTQVTKAPQSPGLTLGCSKERFQERAECGLWGKWTRVLGYSLWPNFQPERSQGVGREPPEGRMWKRVWVGQPQFWGQLSATQPDLVSSLCDGPWAQLPYKGPEGAQQCPL